MRYFSPQTTSYGTVWYGTARHGTTRYDTVCVVFYAPLLVYLDCGITPLVVFVFASTPPGTSKPTCVLSPFATTPVFPRTAFFFGSSVFFKQAHVCNGLFLFSNDYFSQRLSVPTAIFFNGPVQACGRTGVVSFEEHEGRVRRAGIGQRRRVQPQQVRPHKEQKKCFFLSNIQVIH